MTAFNRVVATQRCASYLPLVHSFNRGRPAGSPLTRAECKPGSTEFGPLRGNRFCCARQYGTGALMEARGRGKKYAIWALDTDGRFRFAEVLGTPVPQIGTPFTQADEATEVANRFLRATRDRDCAAMKPLINPEGGRLIRRLGSPERACRAVLRGPFLAPALRGTPHPAVKAMGGTRNVAFVGIPTRKAYFTMMLSDFKGSLRVLDVVASTPVKLPKS